MGESDRTLSTAVHVLRALEFTAEHPKGVSVKALARALDVSLSSAYSLIAHAGQRAEGRAGVRFPPRPKASCRA